VRRQTIGLIWIGGILLALALYVVGPDRFLDACLDLIDQVAFAFHTLMFTLGRQAFNVVRALAIAIFIVFLLLAFLAARRGLRASWALVVVSAAFLVLVWRPEAVAPAPIGRWFAALILATVAAVVMTQRLLTAPPPRGPWPPHPGGPA
jgi:hypothetical protein